MARKPKPEAAVAADAPEAPPQAPVTTPEPQPVAGPTVTRAVGMVVVTY